MKATFYNNTGFDSINIPDSFELVEENANEVFHKENINLIQIDNIYKISVKGIVDDIARSIDYVIIESDSGDKTGYYVDDSKGYEFIAPNICSFYLHLDPYITIGGLVNENEIISGSANRMTVNETEENSKYFALQEPFKPALQSTILEGLLDGRMMNNRNMINILETLVIPPKTLTDAETSTNYDTGRSYNGVKLMSPSNPTRNFETATSNADVYQTEENVGGQQRVTSTTINDVQVFEYRQMKETNLTIKGFFGDDAVIKTGSRWWKADQLEGNAIIKGQTKKTSVINDLRITGSDSNINSYWSIPAPYIESNDGAVYAPQEKENYGGISNIKSSLYESGQAPINADYTQFNLKNNKAKYGQGTSIIVYCPVNGNKLEKKWPEIIDVSECNPSDVIYKAPFKIGADIRSEGNPIFAFKYLNGKTGDVNPQVWGYCYGELLNGGNWRQIPISGQGTGNAYNQLTLNRERKGTIGSAIGEGIFGVAQIVGGLIAGATGVGAAATGGLVTSGLRTLTGAAGSYIQSSIKQKDQQEQLNEQGQSASANITYSSSNFVRELGYNSFYVMYIMYHEADMKAFDRFLTLFGYNVGNKQITSDDFDSRPGFNYIRINDIEIQSDKGVWLVERVKEQLKAGVRIWHEMPNNSRIEQGNKM